MLLGNTTKDPLHSAFGSKRVVHAGLMGEPITGSQYQKKYYESIQKKADVDGKHAIYIHIPFCQTKCLYCGFYQNASRQEVEDQYMENLLAEIKAEANRPQLKGTPIDCVFIGGGTPTSLSVDNVARLLQTIQHSFCLTVDCEVTLEGRIHDLVPEKIEIWLKYGVNRISLGVQSFDTTLRRRIGRIDSREEVLKRLQLLKRYDVTVIVDLIFGLPGQTMEVWLEDVRTLFEADVDGMDLYQLNIFPGGPLAKAPQMRQIADGIIGNLEKGYVDFRHLLTTDSRLSELEKVLALWQERGLLEKDLGVFRLTPAGEFWYVSLTQSLLECVQVVMTSSAAAPAEDINGHASDALDEVLAEMLPQSTQESRQALMGKIPTAVRMMLRRSSKESLQSMLAGMPPAMREKMFSRASG